MANPGDRFENLLLSSFVESEKAFLMGENTFTVALAAAQTAFDVERLRTLAEQLLDTVHRANTSARQLRQSQKSHHANA
jgi:hypothetical protein